ncbi:hypothetical protein DFQ28_002762 [Apophysomyces sp. BC1034]|nr:hypothetical protein DFQ29_003371 [Apophysomyces sp. BC1021]KAG0193887.1 hypothetical protein DFQ28_002762 [Apophysomyces sp. BC1034]
MFQIPSLHMNAETHAAQALLDLQRPELPSLNTTTDPTQQLPPFHLLFSTWAPPRHHPKQTRTKVTCSSQEHGHYWHKKKKQKQPMSKPRWQKSERLGLLRAIVKEKELDDMATFRWDQIAMSVGRAQKACKDQWRREILPNLLKNLNPLNTIVHENDL